MSVSAEVGFKVPGLANSWYQVMLEREGKPRERFEDSSASSEKMFSLWFYYWMVEQEKLDNSEVDQRLFADGWTYLAERVFKLPYNELDLQYTNDDIYGVLYGGKGLMDMCRDAVDLRRIEGVSDERALHEGLGMWDLLDLLKVMEIGETSVLVSPPDPDDPNMGDYTLIYLYEKVANKKVKMGIITDQKSSIEDWRSRASKLSRDKFNFKDYSHLAFVAEPFVANKDFASIKKELLGEASSIELPNWAIDQLKAIIPHVREAVMGGRIQVAEELFNAFKIAVTSKILDGDNEIDPLRLVRDRWYFHRVSQWYLQNGGSKYLNQRTGCALDRIDLARSDLMNNQFSRFTRFDVSDGVASIGGSGVEVLVEGEKACYQCPVCESEGHTPAGDVHLKSGYLVCSENSEKHRLRYGGSD